MLTRNTKRSVVVLAVALLLAALVLAGAFRTTSQHARADGWTWDRAGIDGWTWDDSVSDG
jgi:hypothetical protein